MFLVKLLACYLLCYQTLSYWFVRVFYSKCGSFVKCENSEYILSFHVSPFQSTNGVLINMLFSCNVVSYIYKRFSVWITLLCPGKKFLPQIGNKYFLFFSKWFIILHVTFNIWFIQNCFSGDVRDRSQNTYFLMTISYITLSPLSKSRWPHMCRSICVLSILFHCLVSISLHPHQTFLIIISL